MGLSEMAFSLLFKTRIEIFHKAKIIHGQDLRTANEKKNFPPHDEIFVILPPLLRVSPGGNSPTPRSKILSSTPGRIIFTPPIGSKISFYPPYLIKNFILPPLNCKFVVTPRRILPPPRDQLLVHV